MSAAWSTTCCAGAGSRSSWWVATGDAGSITATSSPCWGLPTRAARSGTGLPTPRSGFMPSVITTPRRWWTTGRRGSTKSSGTPCVDQVVEPVEQAKRSRTKYEKFRNYPTRRAHSPAVCGASANASRSSSLRTFSAPTATSPGPGLEPGPRHAQPVGADIGRGESRQKRGGKPGTCRTGASGPRRGPG